MSLIFDALQRSEGERSGIDLSALPDATDLLDRVERQMVSEWELSRRSVPSTTTDDIEHDAVIPSQAKPASVVAESSTANALTRNDREQLHTFVQFKALQVSVPPQSQLVCFTDTESLAAEKFRFLGVRLRHLRRERALKKVLITSTIPREGKSTVAANLACVLARKKQQRTLLIDGDVRRPSLGHTFGLRRLPGLCEWLEGNDTSMTNIYRLEGPDLWILPAGNPSGNPLELLQSSRLSNLMDQLAGLFDWIVIDSPPVLPLADTSVWSRLADGIVLVARQGTTEKRQLQKGLEAIDNQKLIGALLNCSHNSAASEHYYYYRRSVGTEADDKSDK